MKDAFGRIQRVLVLGGGSDIAHAILHNLLSEGPLEIALAARNPEAIDDKPLTGKGAKVVKVHFDASERAAHAAVIDGVFPGSDIDLVLLAFGVLGNQQEDERDPARAVEVADVNFLGAISALTLVGERLRQQSHGTIAVLSSIAGQRARRSNYIYGSSKAGLDAFAQGLQLALQDDGINVIIVRPGFVRTKMTTGMAPAPLSVNAEEVAQAVVTGIRSGSRVVWAPSKLRFVATILRLLPARVIAKL